MMQTPAILGFQHSLQMLHAIEQCFGIRPLLSQCVRNFMIIQQSLRQRTQAARHFGKYGCALIQRRFLRDVGDIHPWRHPQLSIIQLDLTCQNA